MSLATFQMAGNGLQSKIKLVSKLVNNIDHITAPFRQLRHFQKINLV